MTERLVFIVLFGIGLAAVILFNFVVFYGAPFLPTRRARLDEALDLLALRPGQTLLELGSGDGRLLRAAARREVYSIGYELNPALVVWSRIRGWRRRKYMRVRWANYWRAPLPTTDGIYVFLLQPYMTKLDKKVRCDLRVPVRLVSFAFPIPHQKVTKEQSGFFVYEYEAHDH